MQEYIKFPMSKYLHIAFGSYFKQVTQRQSQWGGKASTNSK